MSRKYAAPFAGFAVLLLALALGLAACGGGGSSSSGGSETESSGSTSSSGGEESSALLGEAESEAAAILKRPTHIPQTEPIKGKFPTGKTIDLLQCAVPACVEIGEHTVEAAEVVGWKVNIVNEGSTPEEFKAAFEKAVLDKPDAVIETDGDKRATFEEQVKELKELGIPIVGHSEQEPASKESNYISVVSGPVEEEETGKQLANWMLTETEGDTHALNVPSEAESNISQQENVEKRFKEVCSSNCVAASYVAPFSTIGSSLAGKVASLVQANPETNYVWLGFGDMAVGVNSAFSEAGVEPVPLVTTDPNSSNLGDIGSGAIAAAYSEGDAEGCWGTINVLGHYFAHQPYEEEIQLAKWWITAKGLEEANAKEEVPPAVENYQEQFKELWGVK